jgi:outer membrane immunogenic protein
MNVNTAAKTSTTALVAAAAASSGAFGADMPLKAPILVAPTWDGWYVGGSAGAAWLRSLQDDSSIGSGAVVSGYHSVGTGGAAQTATNLAAMLGLQLGRNWQVGSFVYGVEADISWLNAKASTTSAINARALGYGYSLNAQTNNQSKIDALATFRARFGIDFNGTMPYLTAGFAIADTKDAFSVSGYGGNVGPRTYTNTQTSWVPGMVVGGGVERQLGRNWTLRGEVMWVGLRSRELGSPWPSQISGYIATPSGAAKTMNDLTIGRIGLNYRF